METKIKKEFIDMGFGFPIRLAVKAQELANLYDELQTLPEGKSEPIHLDAKKTRKK